MRIRAERAGGRVPTTRGRIARRWVGTVASLTLLAGTIVAISASFSASKHANHQKDPQDAARPNILFVLTDDQRYESLWAMPTVESQLADRGVTLTNYFLTDPLCCPSRASIMRGQYPHGTGVYNNDSGPYGGYPRFHAMGDDLSNVATWLQDAGYHTGMIGKYFNGYGPDQASIVPPGWDEWNALVIDHYYRFAESVNGTYTTFDPKVYQTDVEGQQAVDFIRNTPPGQPLFLYWAPHAPHAAAVPAPQDVGTFSNLPPYRPPSFNEADVSDKPAEMQRRPISDSKVTKNDLFLQHQYEALQDVDRQVGRMLDELSATGRLSDTLIVYTTDNGIMLGEHRFSMTKNLPYEESIRSPFVARWDGVIPAGLTDPRIALNIDLAPTFAAAAGATPTNQVDGSDLMPVLTGAPDASWRHDFLVEHGGGAGVAPPFCEVQNDAGYAYINYFTAHDEELYDLNADSYELTNIAADPGHHDAIAALRARARQLCSPEPPVMPDQYSHPNAPVDVSASAANGVAIVTWSPPPADGGSPVKDYKITSDPGGVVVRVDGSATSAKIGDLPTGSYAFRVKAENAYGGGPLSDPSNAVWVEPSGPPAAPRAVVATPGEGSAIVAWTAPDDGGSRITGYTVTASPDGVSAKADGSSSSVAVPGLSDGVSYTFTVTATNALGTGPPSDPSNAVVPGVPEAPMAPADVQASPEESAALVGWDAPAGDGGSAITRYTVTSSPGGISTSVDASATSATVDGLADGTSYRFTVTATNGVGTGPASDPSNPVTPGLVKPQVSGFSPTSARVGEQVGVIGSGLASTAAVTIGGVRASFEVLSDDQVTVTVPDGSASGPIAVVTPGGSALSSGALLVPPSISGLDPASGRAGDVFAVSGSVFVDVKQVTLNHHHARFWADSYWSLRVKVPYGASSGVVMVVTGSGKAKSKAWFTLISGPGYPDGNSDVPAAPLLRM